MPPPPLPRQKRPGRIALIAWLAFLASFPAGMFAGWLMAHGQDPAGAGIGIGLGMLGVGLFGGILAAIFVSLWTIRALPHAIGKCLALLPWLILTAFWYITILTPTGDHVLEWLQDL